MANFFSSGQVCTNGTRVFVPKALLADFEAAIRTGKRIRIGDPMAEQTNFDSLTSFRIWKKSCLSLSQANNKVPNCSLAVVRQKAELAQGAYVLPGQFSVTAKMICALLKKKSLALS